MSKLLHGLFHAGAVVVQYAAIASGVIPAPYGAIVAAAVAGVQGIVAAYNHAHGK